MTASDDPREGAPEPSESGAPTEQRFESRRERRAHETGTSPAADGRARADAPTGALDPRDLPPLVRVLPPLVPDPADQATGALDPRDVPRPRPDPADQPTGALDPRDIPRPKPDPADQPTGALDPRDLPRLVRDPEDLPTGALDPDEVSRVPHAPLDGVSSLFAEHRFTEVHDEPILPALPALPARAARRPGPQRPARPSAPLGGAQRALLWASGALVAVLALVGLYALGSRMPQLAAAGSPAPAPVSSRTQPAPPTPQTTASAPAAGPVAAGVHEWSDLRGGECVQPFASAWAQSFTVVDCAEPHAAQLLVRAALTDVPAGAAYPGVDQLQSRMGVLCSAPSAIDYAAASGLSDVQVQAAYPADDAQWAAGDRDYFCFATRASGEALSGSLAPSAAATPAG